MSIFLMIDFVGKAIYQYIFIFLYNVVFRNGKRWNSVADAPL